MGRMRVGRTVLVRGVGARMAAKKDDIFQWSSRSKVSQ